MGGLRHRFLLVTGIALALSPALAWAPETRVRMIDEAVRLMPASLSAAFGGHRADLLRGMLEPMADEDGPRHRPPWGRGSLDAVIESEARGLIDTLGQPGSFAEIGRRFGRLAHYVADAGFPPGASETDGAARYAHFARFCEDRRERFPLVFYGHDDDRLAAGDWHGFALRVMRQASRSDVELARAYAAAGSPPDPSHFGDRSVPFAVGSLAYSHSINDIVRIWLSVWQRAGGDMGRIPYWEPPRTGDD